MKPYVDGYVLPISADKISQYEKMANLGGKIWMKHGALTYFECLEDDMNPEMPEECSMRNFREVANANNNEKVVFAFIVFKSREHRDEVNAKVMADPEMTADPDGTNEEMPFAMEKMAYGGFSAFVNHEKE